MTNSSNTFGENLKRIREGAGLLQEDLAQLLWPDRGAKSGSVQISSWERGARTPRRKAQEQLAAALGKQVSDFWVDPQQEEQEEAKPEARPSGYTSIQDVVQVGQELKDLIARIVERMEERAVDPAELRAIQRQAFEAVSGWVADYMIRSTEMLDRIIALKDEKITLLERNAELVKRNADLERETETLRAEVEHLRRGQELNNDMEEQSQPRAAPKDAKRA